MWDIENSVQAGPRGDPIEIPSVSIYVARGIIEWDFVAQVRGILSMNFVV